MGCSGVFRGCSGGVPGTVLRVFPVCSGVFRVCSGCVPGCSGFYRHPLITYDIPEVID